MRKPDLRLICAVALFAATPAFAATLFPQPMHIVRRVDDPISRAETTLHEYCSGNRVVSVSGNRVAIADYDRQQLTEIDRAAGTYSITRFDEIAKANKEQRGRSGVSVQASQAGTTTDEWTSTSLGPKTSRSGRAVETHAFSRGTGDAKRSVEVGIDRRVALSRDAVEVLVGAAYPNERTPEHDVVMRAAGGMRGVVRANATGSAAQEAEFALPTEQTMSFEIAGQTITVKNSIVSVTAEAPPDDVMQIPPGAKQVESRITRLVRELRELDELPGTPRK